MATPRISAVRALSATDLTPAELVDRLNELLREDLVRAAAQDATT